ncbi:MAG: teichoic acid biosynthesis protein [Deltaproteobacteria bacterium]|nr:teichoic acid biosynthesis protein [Deltaproteobacteria bacterium]
MRILYGVVGEGMGHAIRSRVILDDLTKRHDVQVVVSGRAHDYLQKRAGEHLSVKKIWGLTIVAEDNEVSNFRTVLENLKGAVTGGWPKNVKTYFDIAKDFRPDVVISDFESWSYLFAKNHGIPCISIDNMQIINRCTHAPEITRGHEADFQIAKGIVKAKVPGSYHYLVSTFFYPEIRKKRTTLHPPILRPEILAAQEGEGDHLLVYQTYTSNTELPALLQKTGRECRIYGLRRDLKAEVREGNLRYMPFSEDGFIDDLRTAHGVVASGGFTLMGEAVYLRRPQLSVPVQGQFEQVLNARYLDKLGFGRMGDEMSSDLLGAFLERVKDYKENLVRYTQDGNTDLLAKLEDVLGRAQRREEPEAE